MKNSYFLFPSLQDDTSRYGGKAAALNRLSRYGLPIPAWCVVSTHAFFDALSDISIEEFQHLSDWKNIATQLDKLTPPASFEDELQEALEHSFPNECQYFAVRSSAADEDGSQHSFAGQLESFLYIPRSELVTHIIKVWRSGFSEHLLRYRRERGLEGSPSPPAVLIQQMLRAETAGVAFGADPVSGRRDVSVISAVYGLGHILVSGDVDADSYRIDQQGKVLEQTVCTKTHAYQFDEQTRQIAQTPVASDLKNVACLRPPQISEIQTLLGRVNEIFQRPQDIEWAYENGKLFLLQSRPITSLSAMPDPGGETRIWDNSNIAESYNGVTTPLTFSFARSAYEEVYRQFCRLMSVPANTINSCGNVFRNMLGLIQGRIYYNLINWYRLLSLLPGFKMNRRFMEQMMGVKEGIPDEFINIEKPGSAEKFFDSVRFLRTLLMLFFNHLSLPKKIDAFYQRLNRALALSSEELKRQHLDELAKHYRELEAALLTRWDAPLINDFYAMIFYGALKSLSSKWCNDEGGNLHNELLQDQGGIISAEPAQRVCEMAALVQGQQQLIETLEAVTPYNIEQSLSDWPEFYTLYSAYLRKFGDRCVDELKLESETLNDNPLSLIRSVVALARRDPPVTPNSESKKNNNERWKDHIGNKPIKRRLFAWVLRNARARVRDRENLRFERTRVFGRVRSLFVEIGKRLYAEGVLLHPRDVFYLSVEESLGFIEGTAISTQLAELAQLRRREFEHYSTQAVPADRFDTKGAVYIGNSFVPPHQASFDQHASQHAGTGCCPGIVRGRVRVITDPRSQTLEAGEILVAERTDPGWIMLFASASGLLVERGSLLSHAAIVAREMSIPAIVAIEDVTKWLKSGDLVEFDGTTGKIWKLEEAEHVE
ncbi:MAG: PEP-utilizing enzyme [Gammaproteobacteria bacterium]|nr:PEP-utilizing enzyme [Gammaproteobacteria bacterium]